MARKKVKATKAEAVKTVATNVRVVDDVHQHVTRHGDPDDRWDRDSTASDHHIRGIEVTDGYFDLTVPFEVKEGHQYYLVYVIYDTGDSFGRDDGQITFLDLFESREKAEALADAVSADYRGQSSFFGKGGKNVSHQVKYVREDGTECTCYTGTWKGYFENYCGVSVEQVSVVYNYREKRGY